ncbi:MAG: Wzz/FepE/Etk N-terminal domain-containing protein [Chloroflexaceae bacterium]|nr:Wzz/FepE/Etk N-terminal domain-containing protein [Chloroflexaceae bacterium]
MQLRAYLGILRRFWWLLLALPLLVGAVSLVLELGQPQRYGSSARIMLSQEPQPQPEAAPFPDVNLSYSWQSTVYLLDDLPQVVASRRFAEDVSQLLASQGTSLPPEAVQGSISVNVLHRAVQLSASAPSPELPPLLVQSAVEALRTNGLNYWGRPGAGTGIAIAVIDPPGTAAPLRGMRQVVLNVGLRVALALAAAVGLVFLLHYLDDRLRDRRQVEDGLGMRVVGVIPKE